jgi:hypothetical protein
MAKKQSFADQAKGIMNKYKVRLGEKFDKGDTLALEAMNQELGELREKQEEARINKLVAEGVLEENNQFKCGGKLSKHRSGGKLPMYQGDEEFPNYLLQDNYAEPFVPSEEIFSTPTPTGRLDPRYLQESDPGQFNVPDVTTLGIGENIQGTSTVPVTEEGVGVPYKTRVPWFGAAAQGIGALLMNRGDIDLDQARITPERYMPRTVSYARGREASKRERDLAQAMIRRGARGRGTKSGLTSTIIAGATGTQREAGKQISGSFEREANVNAQIRNEAAKFNAQQRRIAAAMNAGLTREEALINEQRRQGRIAGVTGAVTGYGKDLLAADKYDQMVEMMKPENYERMSAGQRHWLLRALGISDKAQIGFVNRGARTANP